MKCPAGCQDGFKPRPEYRGKECLGCGAVWDANNARWLNLPAGRWVYVLEREEVT